MIRYGHFISIIAVILVGAMLTWWYKLNSSIDADEILQNSLLKDKTFTTKVQELEINGLKALLFEEHSNPIIAVSFEFERAGSAYEAENKQSLSLLLTEMLLNGAGDYDALQFKDVAEEYGVQIDFETGTDNISGTLMAPRKNLDMAVKLFTSALYKPYFTYDYIALTKGKMQTALRNHKEQPNGILADKFAEIIFAGHPYSRPFLGLPETINGITRNDLISYMRTHFTKKNLIIGIVGDVNSEEATQLMDKLFGQLPETFEVEPISEFMINSQGKEHYITKNFPQTVTSFTARGTHRNSPDFYPLYIANYVFGSSGLNSRISKLIREEEGLTYGIYTYLTTKKTLAAIAGEYSSTTENFARAKELLLNEWQKMGTQGITAEELQQAKDAMIASHNLRFASVAGVADMLVAIQQYDLGLDFLEKRNDYVRKVTLEEVNAAAKKYFANLPDFVAVGNPVSEKEE